jgi:hypothetical protein
MDRRFDAVALGSHCIPTKRRRFADQSAVTLSYAADESMRARIDMYARERERNTRWEVPAWTC